MKNKAIIHCFVMVLFLFPCVVRAMGLEAAFGVAGQAPSGDIGYKGTSLDIKNDLNYGDATQVYGRLKVETPSFLPNVYFFATPMNFSAAGRKKVSFTFNNQTFTGSVPFTSTLQLDHYDLALYYGLPFLETATSGFLTFDLGMDARLINFDASINQSATGLSASKSLIVPVPLVYVSPQSI